MSTSVYSLENGQIVGRESGASNLLFSWSPIQRACRLTVREIVNIEADIPLPVSIRTSLMPLPHIHTITTPLSDAELAGVPTLLNITPELVFADNVTLVISGNDSQIQYKLSSSLVTVSASGEITATGQGIGVTRISVIFFPTNLTVEILFEVVQANSLIISLTPHPSYPGSENHQITTLSPLEDSNEWQQGVIMISLNLTNGQLVDVTSTTLLTVSDITATSSPDISNEFILSVSNTGFIEIQAVFGSMMESRGLIIITNNPVRVVGLSLNPLPGNQLSGVAGIPSTQVSLVLMFSDNTSFLSYPSPTLPADLVSFSTTSNSFSISSSGVLTPLENSLSAVTLIATSRDGSVNSSTSFTVDLEPGVGDVDLIVPIGEFRFGDDLAVDVIVNTGDNSLGTVELTVSFDDQVLAPVDGEVGANWTTGLYDISLYDSTGTVRLGAVLTGDSVAGTKLHLFTLHFVVIAQSMVGESYFQGEVVTISERTEQGSPIGLPLPRPFIAGDVLFHVEASRKRSVPDIQPDHRVRRQDVDECPTFNCSCSGVSQGDVDGNCVFDLRDVSFTLLYLSESLTMTGSVMPFNIDQNGDGARDTTDVYFLFQAAFGHIYFLQNVDITPVQDITSKCRFSVTVQLFNRYNFPPTSAHVLVDLSLDSQSSLLGTDSVTGTSLTANKGSGLIGAVYQANMVGGLYTVELNAEFISSTVGVSIIVVSYSTQNQPNTQRVTQFFGPPPPTTGPLNLTLQLPVGPLVLLSAINGYSPLMTVSNTIRFSECSDEPLLDQPLNATFLSPFRVILMWSLRNPRSGLNFTQLLSVEVIECSLTQERVQDTCITYIRSPVDSNTNHSLPTTPFTEYTFRVFSTADSISILATSPESPPVGVAAPTYEHIEGGVVLMWNLPSQPNGIITLYTITLNSQTVFNGSSNIVTLHDPITIPSNVSLEAHNSAGSTLSPTAVIPPTHIVTATPDPGLSVAITDVIIVCVVLTVLVILLLLVGLVIGMTREKWTWGAKEKPPPPILSLDFSEEMMGVEEIPRKDDSVNVLLSLDAQKGQHFSQKFTKDDSQTFWYQDEKNIELYPQHYESSADDSSSEEEFSGGEFAAGYNDQWHLGETAPDDEFAHLSDLWEDPTPQGRGRKYNFSKSKSSVKHSSKRKSGIFRRLSRHREEDQMQLLEEGGAHVSAGEPDLLSDQEMENFQSQIASFNKEQKRSSGIEYKKRLSYGTSSSIASEDELFPVDLPEPSSESTAEVAKRLMTTVQVGDYRRQYRALTDVKPQSGATHSRLSVNIPKNRYRNVSAADHTRVTLTDATPLVEGSDYINANFLNGFDRPHAYIATQGPLPETTADFWKMVWQQGTDIIVMTTAIVEKGRKKCEKYWPDQERTQRHGPATVQCSSQTKYKDYTVSQLTLTMEGEPGKRHLTHYNYHAWPDFGNPQPAQFVDMVRKVRPSSKDHPIVVHCSAGLGRSGVFITVHTALETHAAKRKVDVERIVSNLRKQREGMVQTQDQYRFCFESTAAALQDQQRSRTKSVPLRTIEPAGSRPLSMPTDLDQPPSQQQRSKREPSIPPPSPGLPPYTEEQTTPPRFDTPPRSETPPLPESTPSPPMSLSQSSISKPPITETPKRKVSPPGVILATPEVMVTAPSIENMSDREIIQRKYDDFAEKKDKDKPPETSHPKKTPPTSSKQQTKTVEKKSTHKHSESPVRTKPPLKLVKSPIIEEEEIPPPPPTSAPPTLDEIEEPPPLPTSPPPTLEETPPTEEPPPLPTSPPPTINDSSLKGFELPPPVEEEPEEGGFSIGDDQFLEHKPTKKPEEKKQEKSKPVNEPEWSYKKKTPAKREWSYQKKKPTPPVPKVEKKPFRPTMPEVVNKEPVETVERKVGKLVIPGIFGGQEPPKEDPPPPVREKKVEHTDPPVKSPPPVKEKPKPTHRDQSVPASETQTASTPGMQRKIGRLDTSRFEAKSSPQKSTTVPSFKPAFTSSKPVPTPEPEETGNTPPVMKRIKQLEAKGSPSLSRAVPIKLPIPTHPVKLSPTHQIPKVPPVKNDAEDSSSSVMSLLAKFEKKTT